MNYPDRLNSSDIIYPLLVVYKLGDKLFRDVFGWPAQLFSELNAPVNNISQKTKTLYLWPSESTSLRPDARFCPWTLYVCWNSSETAFLWSAQCRVEIFQIDIPHVRQPISCQYIASILTPLGSSFTTGAFTCEYNISSQALECLKHEIWPIRLILSQKY